MKFKSNSARASVLRQWLRAPGSLSRRLVTLGERFEVQTLWQGAARIHRNEIAALGPLARGRLWVREVMLRVDGQALIWARSVSPCTSLAGPWRALLGLGSRPLADLLFKQPNVSRSPLRVERLRHGGPMRSRLARQWEKANGAPPQRSMVWARSSVFSKHGAPLRVMEVFSPLLASVKPQRLRVFRACPSSASKGA
ncbi:MAG: chorismate lyase [Burkholderiales bacterium]|nr:chorismate lyase [Burkholderiales bacterium]